ncbi:MAG: FHA domain-containing protein [Myxococcota bacterium]
MGRRAEPEPETGGAQAPLSILIRVESGFYAGLEWPLEADTVIGRGRKADLMLGEATISRRHARVFREADSLWVEDLGSTNGTQLNGERVTRAPLSLGDEIRMGKLALRLKRKDPDDA